MIGILSYPDVPVVVQAGEAGRTTELIRGNDQSLLARLCPQVRRQSVALDLGAVERIDAAGLAALIALYRSASESGHGFTVFNARPHVLEILSLVGLDRVLMSHNTEEMPHLGPQARPSAA